MKRLVLSIALISCLVVQGQNQKLSLRGSFGVESRSLTTANLLDLIYDDYLDENEKDALFENVNQGMILGYQQSWEAAYTFNKISSEQNGDQENLQWDFWGVKLYQRNFSSLRLSQDAVALGLYGNSPYSGQELDLGNSRYQSWFYSGLAYRFGFNWKKVNFKVEPALVFGHSYSDYQIDDMSVFTAANGSSINIAGNYQLDEAAAGSTYGIAGMGAAADVTMKMVAGKNHWRLQLQDLGLMYWSGEAIKRDTSFNYSGSEINDLSSFRDSFLLNEAQRLEEGFFALSEKGLTRLMPFLAELRYKRPLSENWWATGELAYRFIPGYIPRLALGGQYQIAKNHRFEADVAYGGFNGLTLGIGYRLQIGNSWLLRGTLRNLPAFILPQQTTGTLLMGSISYSF